MPFPVVPAIAAGASLAGTALSSMFGKKRDERQFKHEQQMSEYAHSKDLEMWERMNEYNAPTAQMARLREAGLNPAMIYGSGGAKTQATTMPKYQAPRPQYRYGSPIDSTSILGAYQSFQRHNAEMDLLRKQADLQDQNIQNKYVDYLKKSADYGVKYESDQGYGGKQWLKKTKAYQMQEAQLQVQENRKRLLDKEIEYYLYKQLGSAAVSLFRSGASGLGKIFKTKSLPKGVTMRKTPKISERDWSQWKNW